MKNLSKLIAAVLVAIALVSCGGGSGSAPAPGIAETPSTPLVQASGQVTLNGLDVVTFTPDASGFRVTVSDDGWRFYTFTRKLPTPADISISSPPGGTASVGFRSISETGQLTYGYCEYNCGVKLSSPNGATHPITINLSNTRIVSYGSTDQPNFEAELSGKLVGEASNALWNPRDFVQTTRASLKANGQTTTVISSQFLQPQDSQKLFHKVRLTLDSGLDIVVTKANTQTVNITASQMAPNFDPNSRVWFGCTTCAATFNESDLGVTITFPSTSLAETPLFGATPTAATLNLSGTVFVAKPRSSLRGSSLGNFIVSTSRVISENDSRFYEFDRFIQPTDLGWFGTVVGMRGGQVTQVAVFDNRSESQADLWACDSRNQGSGYPTCNGVSLGSDGLTLSFSNTAVAKGTGTGATIERLNGVLTAKGR
jgi:hypothetical protein